MNKLEILKNDYIELCEEFERASNYMHFIGEKVRDKKKKIEDLESRTRFKYNGARYHVRYEELEKPHRSLLLKNINNGSWVIKINSELSTKERQEELHIMLKRKKCLKYYGGAR
ncbi:hypothetical protein [Clostridium cadaveris]|uniref:hypothetical protein n=1 Tax=Clostridium cadaveris TaxID=1529 RepID=UPI00399417D6